MNGVVVELDGQEHENGAGKTANTSFTYVGVAGGENPGENPGEDPGTVVPPVTGDATVSIFAIIVVLALCVALVLSKKRSF